MNLELGPPTGPLPYVIEERRRTDPQRDRIRLAVLAELGLLFAQGGDHLAILQRVTEIAVPSLGDWCAVDLRTKHGLLDRVAVRHREGTSGRRSQLAVPLSIGRRVLGVLSLARTTEPAYDRDDLAFAEELARRVAMFVDHAILLRDQARLIDELEKTNRDLDQFAYIASHDLKAPLRGIGTLATVIEEDLGDRIPETARTHLKLLRGRTKRLEDMIDGVLRYCRAGRVDDPPVWVDTRALVRELIELIGAPEETSFEIDPQLPTLHAVRAPLEQVFLNLIGNALKHGGRSDLHIAIGGSPVQGGWELAVRDNGPGIAPEHHETIWGVFRTLASRDVVETTGVGLAIVRRIVDSVGGRAWVESELGGGATFRFTWPNTPAVTRHWSSR